MTVFKLDGESPTSSNFSTKLRQKESSIACYYVTMFKAMLFAENSRSEKSISQTKQKLRRKIVVQMSYFSDYTVVNSVVYPSAHSGFLFVVTLLTLIFFSFPRHVESTAIKKFPSGSSPIPASCLQGNLLWSSILPDRFYFPRKSPTISTLLFSWTNAADW